MAKVDGLNQIMAGSVIASDLANSGVTSGTYGSSTQIPVVVVNPQGQLTGVTLATVQRTVIFCIPGAVIAGADTGSRLKVPTTLNGLTLIGLQFRIDTVASTNTSLVLQLSTAVGVFAAATTSQTITITAGTYETSATSITTAVLLATDNKLGVSVSLAGTGGKDITVAATFG